MISLFHLFKFRGHNVLSDDTISSHSFLIETYRYYVRNSFLFMFALCSLRQTFGPNIVCHTEGYRISQDYVDTKCFINGTMTVDEAPTSEGNDGRSFIYRHHQYYQWIPLVLLLQAIAFQLPYSAWIRRYGRQLKHCTFLPEEYDRPRKQDDETSQNYHLLLVREIVQCRGYGLFDKTVLLEVGYAVLVAVQSALINEFLNRELKFFDWKTSVEHLFPESGKCNFNYYSGGDQTEGKFICLLPLNALYAKLFMFVYVLFFSILSFHVLVIPQRVWSYYLGQANERWMFKLLMDRISNWHHRAQVTKEFDQFLISKRKRVVEQSHKYQNTEV